ncbi:aminoacyl-tRNA hydrolase [Oligoflexia bacterium]|nr:aminoacyl-tRNA hydrolase [Oligoflexia bacterium]
MIAGLGNPGNRYAFTRHNIGFMVLDLLFEENREGGKQVSWQEKSGAQFSKLWLDTDKILAVKPQKYMNLSGEPVQSLMHFFKVPLSELIVVHDDVDLPFGQLRIKAGGGDGGHKGIRSIAACIGTTDFIRLKLGVGRPEVQNLRSEQAISDWVLKEFLAQEEEDLRKLLQQALDALREIRSNGVKSAQNEFNTKQQDVE